jgi:hypothetical protein
VEKDIHYVTEYPQFVDTTNDNFHLISNSPCIDVGTDVGLRKDADNTNIPQDSGYDIGTFEYIQEQDILPKIIIDSIYEITTTSVKVSCTVISEGSSSVTERGVSFNDGNLILNIIDNNTGLGHFIINPDILTPNTHYIITGYVISNVGTYETYDEFITTKLEPIIILNSIFDISLYSCKTEGNLVSDGGETIIELGTCYKYILPENPIFPPTIKDLKVINTSDTYIVGKNYTESLTKLNRKIPIYVRRYIKNKNGIFYSEMMVIPIIKTIIGGTFILENGSSTIIETE